MILSKKKKNINKICIANNFSQVQTNGKHTFYLHESTVKAAKEVVMDRQVRSNFCTESLYYKCSQYYQYYHVIIRQPLGMKAQV